MDNKCVFTAEKIVDQRKNKELGRIEYLIKWKGYSSKENTWEPEEHIYDKGLIDSYERNQSKSSPLKALSSRTKSSKTTRTPTITKTATTSAKTPATTTPKTIGKSIAIATTTISTTPPPSTITKLPTPPATAVKTTTVATLTETSSTSTSTTPPPLTAKKSSSPIPTPQPVVVKTTTVATSTSPKSSSLANYVAGASSASTPKSKPNVVYVAAEMFNNNSNYPKSSVSTVNKSQQIVTSTPVISQSPRLMTKYAIMNTVITDVTVNDQTITISESKTNQGFFKEVDRFNVSI